MSPTPITNTVGKAIGRLAGEYKTGDKNALTFANAADAAMDPLRELERENAKLREDNKRLRIGIDRVGFYFAGNEQYHHVSARCLSLLRGETIDEACLKAWEAKTPQEKNDALYKEFSDNPQG